MIYNLIVVQIGETAYRLPVKSKTSTRRIIVPAHTRKVSRNYRQRISTMSSNWRENQKPTSPPKFQSVHIPPDIKTVFVLFPPGNVYSWSRA